MLVKTLEAKKAHPLLSKIPDNLWIFFFKNGFDDDLIPGSDKRLNQAAQDDFPKNSEQALIILLIRYPEVQVNELMSFIRDILKTPNSELFNISAAMGRLDILELLCLKVPKEQLQMMSKSENYFAFRWAAHSGHLDACKWLMAQTPEEQWLEMIETNDYDAFLRAAENGHLDTCKWLMAQTPEEQHLKMIKMHDYFSFRKAAKNGHLDTCKWLMAQTSELQRVEMLKTYDYSAFDWAAENRHLDICKWLLQIPQCLAFAERQIQEYGEQIVNPFIQETLATLHQEYSLGLQLNPNAVFNLDDPQRAQSCFYILRNLIRRNDCTLNDEILFLLEIPAVRALLHTAVTPYCPNELLRLALTTGNQDAAARLFAIPAVRELAERNNFYHAAQKLTERNNFYGGEVNGQFVSELLNKPQATGARVSEAGIFATQSPKDKLQDKVFTSLLQTTSTELK